MERERPGPLAIDTLQIAIDAIRATGTSDFDIAVSKGQALLDGPSVSMAQLVKYFKVLHLASDDKFPTTSSAGMSAAIFANRCTVCSGFGHLAPQCPSPRTVTPDADDGTSRPLRGVDREYKKRGTSADEQPPAARTRGTKRVAPTVWTPELGPCRNEDSAGKCGKNHLHKDCPKRAAANAAAAAKKAVAGAQAYVAELHNDEDDSIVFIEIPAGDPLPAKAVPVPVVAATTGPTAAVVVDYIGIALQISAFVIVLAVLAMVLLDPPSPSPPVSAGVFVVLPPDFHYQLGPVEPFWDDWGTTIFPRPPATDMTTWIFSAIAVGISFFFLLSVRRFSFFVRGIDCVAFFVVYTREPSDPGTRPPSPPHLGPCPSAQPTARADWSTSTRTALRAAPRYRRRERRRSEPTTPSSPPALVPAPCLCHASRPSITTRTSTTRVLVTSASRQLNWLLARRPNALAALTASPSNTITWLSKPGMPNAMSPSLALLTTPRFIPSPTTPASAAVNSSPTPPTKAPFAASASTTAAMPLFSFRPWTPRCRRTTYLLDTRPPMCPHGSRSRSPPAGPTSCLLGLPNLGAHSMTNLRPSCARPVMLAIQTIWKHAPDRLICTDIRWWPGSIADRANAPAGYSLAD